MSFEKRLKYRAYFNFGLRVLISALLNFLWLLIQTGTLLKILIFPLRQEKLKARLKVTDFTVRGYDEETEARIEALYEKSKDEGVFVCTSGSTNRPKKMFYTRNRVRSVKNSYFTGVLTLLGFNLHLKTLFVFSSLKEKDSLTAHMTSEDRYEASYLDLLQAPYRALHQSYFSDLVRKYGETVLRLFLLVLSNPRYLYCTNPSTLFSFISDLEKRWPEVRSSLQQLVAEELQKEKTLRQTVLNIVDVGSYERLLSLLQMAESPSLARINPALKSYISWDGGYVGTFIEKLREKLPVKINQLGMFSMSTETVETLPFQWGKKICYLPLAPSVVYEFVSCEGDKKTLLKPSELVPGQSYVMVVSDQFGLCRYDTMDVFLCECKVLGLPSLRFQRRSELSFSFTGEKMTAKQLELAYEILREKFDSLKSAFLTTLPIQGQDALPYYRLICITEKEGEVDEERVAQTLNQGLATINQEWKSKVDSGRLGAFTCEVMSQKVFLETYFGDKNAQWDSQFKFLPLYRRTWDQ